MLQTNTAVSSPLSSLRSPLFVLILHIAQVSLAFPLVSQLSQERRRVKSLLTSREAEQHHRTLVAPSPDIRSSPTRRMCGQCWRVLIKKGFVTPTTMFGLERGERKKQHDVNHGVSSAQTAACVQQGAPGYLRGLCPGGVLFKFAVVDGKVGPVVTAVPQRSEAAVTTHTTVAI